MSRAILEPSALGLFYEKKGSYISCRQRICNRGPLALSNKAPSHTLLPRRMSTGVSKGKGSPVRCAQPKAAAASSKAESTPSSPPKSILAIGITGGIGGATLDGLLEAGVEPSSVHAMTRNPGGKSAQALKARGVTLVQADLDDESSLHRALEGMEAVYCHATSNDASVADPREYTRAVSLAKAAKAAGIKHIVYNGSGGRQGGGSISQVASKHRVEDHFSAELPSTNLEATMFMEEFWKRYTRPQILKGRFPFGVPGDTPIQLLAVKDMGRAAGYAFTKPEVFKGRTIELAGDALSPKQMCELFSKYQNAPVKHQGFPAFLLWFFSKDLYRITKFLSETGYKADIEQCRKEFPGLLTFDEFLAGSKWGDPSRKYEDGFTY